MFVKIHKSYRTVVAICDSNLIGKKFEEKFENGIKQLDIRKNFYMGEEKTYDEIILLMQSLRMEDATFNIVGKESIKAAEQANIIPKNSFLTINKIPYSLVLL